jgi:hypothetical protein
MNELDKFWQHLENKGLAYESEPGKYYLVDGNDDVNCVTPTQQMLIGYMYEYINSLYYKLKPSDFSEAITNKINSAWWYRNKIYYHYQELIDIIKELEEL